MNTQQQRQLIQWLKRISAVVTLSIWLYVITMFLNDPAPFAELVPYCMGSTMLIFGILTGIYKGLEYWEATLKQEHNDVAEER